MAATYFLHRPRKLQINIADFLFDSIAKHDHRACYAKSTVASDLFADSETLHGVVLHHVKAITRSA